MSRWERHASPGAFGDGAVRTYHVSKSYIAGTFALHDLTLEIKKGEFVFLTGSRDFNYRDTRDVFREYGKANVLNIHFMSIKNIVCYLKTQANIEFHTIFEAAMQLQNDSNDQPNNSRSNYHLQEYLR